MDIKISIVWIYFFFFKDETELNTHLSPSLTHSSPADMASTKDIHKTPQSFFKENKNLCTSGEQSLKITVD